MGRIGEVISRTWQTAHKMKAAARPPGDQRRARAPPTTCASAATSPSTRSTRRFAHGMSHDVARSRSASLADIVLWRPALFGARPELVVKGGLVAWSQMGRRQRLHPDAAAGADAPDVRRARPRRRRTSLAFVSQRLARGGRGARPRPPEATLAGPTAAARSASGACAQRRAAKITVNPESYEVHADGELLRCAPATELPLARLYNLF